MSIEKGSINMLKKIKKYINLIFDDLDGKYQKKIKVTGGLTINDSGLLSTNSFNSGSLSSDFNYYVMQSLSAFIVKIKIVNGFYVEPKQGSITRTTNFKNNSNIKSVSKEDFYFDVIARDDSGIPYDFTITGFYEIKKDEANEWIFTLSFTGMFIYNADIPDDDESILNDENNVFSPKYAGKEAEFTIKQKTVLL